MTGDAKLGLLLGVAVVVASALLYYRPEPPPTKPTDAAVKSAAPHVSSIKRE